VDIANDRIDWLGRILAILAAIAVGLTTFSLVRANSMQPPALHYPSTLDLGPHKFGATAIARVVLANDGRGELVVGPFKTSCSCAGVEVERDGKFQRIEQLRIPPHSRFEVVVRIAVGAKPGTSQQVAIVFASNDPKQPEGSFEVHISQVLGGVYTIPSDAIVGDIVQGSTEVRDVFIYANGAKDRRIEAVRVSHIDRFSVELVSPQAGVHEPQVHETAGNMIAVARVRPKPGYVGPIDGYFELIATGETRAPNRVDVIGQVIGPYVCTPDVLSLPRFVGGKAEYTAEFHMARRDGKPITVTADGLPKEIATKIEPAPNDPARVRVVVSCEPGDSTRNIRLRFQARAGEDEPEGVEVPLLVTGRSP
jgi:hypothetical protein